MRADEILVGRLAKGDESALRELLTRYERPLSAFLYRNTGGDDVEDLYQETWIRVVRHASSFDRSRRFSTWMFQIAVNLCRDWRRRQSPESRSLDEDEIGSKGMDDTEAAVDVQRLLRHLPPDQREVLILRYYHDMTEEQVAEILGCPRGTVKSRTHHALARLSQFIRKVPEVAR